MPRFLTALTLAVIVLGCEQSKAPEEKDEVKKSEEPKPEEAGPKPKVEAAAVKNGGYVKYEEFKPVSIPKDKWNLSHAEKAWKVKSKGVKFTDKSEDRSYKDGGTRRVRQHELLFEFTENLPDDELKTLKMTLTGGRGDVEFVYFDSDNVIRERQRGMTVSGEVTGTKGDAFWVILQPSYSSGVVRVELRPVRNGLDK